VKTIDFTQVPVGTRVWDDYIECWGTIVIKTNPTRDDYPIGVDYDNGSTGAYTKDGRLWKSHRPSLWFNEFEVVIPEKAYHSPLPDLEVDTPVLVRDYEQQGWKRQHFSHFKNGKICTFCDGHTKWSYFGGTKSWDQWKLPEEEVFRIIDMDNINPLGKPEPTEEELKNRARIYELEKEIVMLCAKAKKIKENEDDLPHP
jgi:hypothetical protein